MMSSSILSVRVSDSERGLIETAADVLNVKLSDFVRRKMLEASEEALLERRVVEIPAEKWCEIEEWLEAPPKVIPELKKLMQSKPVWEQ